MKQVVWRTLEFLGALLLAPLLLLITAGVLFGTDMAFSVFGRRRLPASEMPQTNAASVVIPNWNGRDLLERYLPSVVEATAGNRSNEIIVVDNGSEDGSVDFVREQFPNIRVLALPENKGFGGGSNAGVRAAHNDIVVLLNSDMRVEPGFLAPLLAGFTAGDVFAISCQIFLSDPAKRREETGLTEASWRRGRLEVSHREDPKVDQAFPCFYAGGGSSAFDRRKFLELGGFDELLAPFYLEDTDVGFLAWKRGWKVLYEPQSVVYHEHRGTIGRKFSSNYIHSVLKKNYLLFAWKNIQEWRSLASNLLQAWAGSLATVVDGERPLRTNLRGIVSAFSQLPGAVRSRSRAHALRAITDKQVFQRSRGSHFRDRFLPVAAPDNRLRVLFVSPYPILPPVHGGAVFMLETLRELSKLCEVHELVLLDEASQAPANLELSHVCASVEVMVRPRNRTPASIRPHSVSEFASDEIRWRIDRIMYLQRIDVLQIEYTPMAQFGEPFRHVLTALFEHDVYFQSIARTAKFLPSPVGKAKARYEYLRALNFELAKLREFDQVQVCTRENRTYLLEFLPDLHSVIHSGLRASIDTGAYGFPGGPREPNTILFIGSSRHEPNAVGVRWFVERVFPEIVARCPSARFLLAGFERERNPELVGLPQVELLGFVEDVKPLLQRCAVFVCPILSGSGVRVKLLEAFASGIPVVSTGVGAEGLADADGWVCSLADEPGAFARKVIALLQTPSEGESMAHRAFIEVRDRWDGKAVAVRLERSYRDGLHRKNGARIIAPQKLPAVAANLS